MKNLTELIKDMQERGLINIKTINFKGQAKAIFEMLELMSTTREYSTLEPEDFGRN